MDWFTVDRQGLAKLLERKGKAWIIFELIQNAWDEAGVTRVDVTLTSVPGRPFCDLTVCDDAPEGFCDLSHAWTLFAESYKKKNPEQRGRYNLGEKLVLALAEEAVITSTKGTVRFDHKGRHLSRVKSATGSVFSARIRMTREEHAAAIRDSRLLLPPGRVRTSINGVLLQPARVIDVTDCTLPTVLVDAEGNLTRTNRRTIVEAILPIDKRPYLYELGIPVCTLDGDEPWSINVLQKVPLNMERDNVTPAYLRALRVAVLNMLHASVTDASQAWVRDAADAPDCSDAAIKTVLDKRFGSKRVSFDPTDLESNKRAVAAGYLVISGGAMSAGEWDNARRAEAIKPAGQVTPTPRPYSNDPDAPSVEVVDHTLVPAQHHTVDYCAAIGQLLLDREITVRIVLGGVHFAAAYGGHSLDLNLRNLSKAFFERCDEGDPKALDELHALLVHEYAHEFSSDHLSTKFYAAVCKLGAKLTRYAIDAQLPPFAYGVRK